MSHVVGHECSLVEEVNQVLGCLWGLLGVGFGVGFLAEKKRRGLAVGVLGAALLYFVVFALVTFDRLFYVGTTAQYLSGSITPLTAHRTLFTVLSVGMTIAFFVLIGVLHRLGMRLDVLLDTVSIMKRYPLSNLMQ